MKHRKRSVRRRNDEDSDDWRESVGSGDVSAAELESGSGLRGSAKDALQTISLVFRGQSFTAAQLERELGGKHDASKAIKVLASRAIPLVRQRGTAGLTSQGRQSRAATWDLTEHGANMALADRVSTSARFGANAVDDMIAHYEDEALAEQATAQHGRVARGKRAARKRVAMIRRLVKKLKRRAAKQRTRTYVQPHAAKRPPCRLCRIEHGLKSHRSHRIDGARKRYTLAGVEVKENPMKKRRRNPDESLRASERSGTTGMRALMAYARVHAPWLKETGVQSAIRIAARTGDLVQLGAQHEVNFLVTGEDVKVNFCKPGTLRVLRTIYVPLSDVPSYRAENPKRRKAKAKKRRSPKKKLKRAVRKSKRKPKKSRSVRAKKRATPKRKKARSAVGLKRSLRSAKQKAATRRMLAAAKKSRAKKRRPKAKKRARNPLLGVLANPKRKRKAKKAARKSNPSRKGRLIRWKDLTPAQQRDPQARAAATFAARLAGIPLSEMVGEFCDAPPGTAKHVPVVGELESLSYKAQPRSRRAFTRNGKRIVWDHKSGDHGRGKARSTPQLVVRDMRTGKPILVSRRGSRAGVSSSRGLLG